MERHPEPALGTADKVTFQRILAYLVDGTIVGGVFGFVYLFVGLLGGGSMLLSGDPTAAFDAFTGIGGVLFLLLFLFAFLLYKPLFEAAIGYTPGKGVFGLVVAKADGGRCTPGAAVIRHLLRIIDFLFVYPPYAIGLFSIGLTEDKQRLGDLAANTVVVKRA
ncbi:RDD family protein [Halorientalis halophila]|uniref:RDD family protein n=1 Tax=Halorientalis halophila TaxID=3108499 RepID=UPI0030085AC4